MKTLEAFLEEIKTVETQLEKDPENYEILYKLGVLYHDIAAEYKEQVSGQAVTLLEKAYAIKKVPVIKAYLGSAWTLVARDSVNPIVKIDAVSKGMKLIDEATGEEPDNVLIRMIRIQNSYELPDSFERGECVKKDLEYLLKVYRKKPEVFRNEYDPAYIFLYQALYLIKEKKLELAYKYAIKGKELTNDLYLIKRFDNVLEIFEE
ncbi:MAG: hypothetical protein JXB88_17215 [Spirochaetales bacterium]|nr:hypothetical protein [Spirochaetales bacterium]